jgi:hypothetical protein
LQKLGPKRSTGCINAACKMHCVASSRDMRRAVEQNHDIGGCLFYLI